MWHEIAYSLYNIGEHEDPESRAREKVDIYRNGGGGGSWQGSAWFEKVDKEKEEDALFHDESELWGRGEGKSGGGGGK